MLELINGREHLYQWDLNQKVIVNETIKAVHYDNGTGDALVCEVYEYNGEWVADIPNIMLQSVWAIKAYAYCGECVRAERIYNVEKRSRPDDYIYTETQVRTYDTLVERIDEIEKNGLSEETVAKSINAYMEANPIDINDLMKTDNTLTLTADGTLKVNTTDDMEKDNTLPITSAGVYVTVGNIEALLKTI